MNIKKHWYYIPFIICLVVFFFIAYKCVNNSISSFDNSIYDLIIKLKSNNVTTFMKIITFTCHTIFLLFIISVLLLVCKNHKYGLYMGFNLLFQWILNSSVKRIIKRARPININLVKETGYSFPSGHTMSAVAMYGFLIVIIWHTNINKKIKIISSVLLTLLILMVGISRIYLGVHYASDVLAGLTLGISYLIVFTKLFYKDMTK